MRKLIVNNDEQLVNVINNVIENNWKYTRKEMPIFSLTDLITSMKIKENKCNNSSNWNKALKECFNELAVDNFNIVSINNEPRFDVSKSYTHGFSFSGRNYLLIAFKRFENNHIEIVYTYYTEWLN